MELFVLWNLIDNIYLILPKYIYLGLWIFKCLSETIVKKDAWHQFVSHSLMYLFVWKVDTSSVNGIRFIILFSSMLVCNIIMIHSTYMGASKSSFPNNCTNCYSGLGFPWISSFSSHENSLLWHVSRVNSLFRLSIEYSALDWLLCYLILGDISCKLNSKTGLHLFSSIGWAATMYCDFQQ